MADQLQLYDLDQREPQRRRWERAQVLKMLAEVSGDRRLFKEKLNAWRAANWLRAFGGLMQSEGAEVVAIEEMIEQKGQFNINRSTALNSGHLSQLYGAVHLPTSKKLVAKCVAIKSFGESLKMKAMNRQARLLSKLNHPNLVRLHKHYEVKATLRWYFIMQQARLGSIESIMKTNNGRLNDELTQSIALDIARGLSYLHCLGIAHRRVNPRHVLLSGLDAPAKLSLVDSAVEICGPDGQVTRARSVGTPDPFCAPETIFGTSFDAFPADVWAYGCTVYFMLVAQPPFYKWNNKVAMKEQIDLKSWTKCGISDQRPRLSQASKAFLEAIIHGAIDKRPCVTEILDLPWLAQQGP